MNKADIANKGTDGTKTNSKGESKQSPQKGAPGVSNKTKGTHKKDESDGAAKNTTKKQQNSI
jgi:hypothetical protein